MCLQAATAGGHRGTHTVAAHPNDLDALALLAATLPVVAVPLVVAGGLATREQVRAVLAAGATAVQVGTALLRTPEAGTRAVHREALVAPSSRHRRDARLHRPPPPGRCATGSPTGTATCPRGASRWSASSPRACVPERPPTATRTAWRSYAGTGHREARAEPAGEVVRDLSG